MGKAFRRTLKRAELPAFWLDDLRHTFASFPLAAGRSDHIRERAARSREPDDDAAPLREMDPEQRPTMGRGSRSRRLAVGAEFWKPERGMDLHNAEAVGEVIGGAGEPSGTRTRDPLIKSSTEDSSEQTHPDPSSQHYDKPD